MDNAEWTKGIGANKFFLCLLFSVLIYQTLISLQSSLLLLPVATTLSESAHSTRSDKPLLLANNLVVAVTFSLIPILHYNFIQCTEQNFGSSSEKKNTFSNSSVWASIATLSKSSCRTITVFLSVLMKCKTSTWSSTDACSSSGILKLSQLCELGKGKIILLLSFKPGIQQIESFGVLK